MKTIVLAVLLMTSAVMPAIAGNCNVPEDRAADGSRCGERAASEKEGGQ